MDFEYVEKTAKKVLLESGQHFLQFIVIKGDKATIIGAPTSNREDHEDILEKMRAFVHLYRPERYFCITEAWLVSPKSEQDLSVRPRDNPRKQEALLVSEFRSDLTKRHAVILFKHKGKDIIITGRHEPSESHSRMNFFLEDCSDSYLDMARREIRKNSVGDKHGKKN